MVNPQQHPGGGTHAPSADPSGAGQLKDTARSLVDDATSEAKDKVEDLRGAAADKVDTLAEGIQAAASKFEGDDVGHMSEYVTELADSLGRLSSSMRDKSGDELLKEITRLARDNPALFVTGSIAVGFGLSRFAKASTSRSGGHSADTHRSASSSSAYGSRTRDRGTGAASTPAGTSSASGSRPGVAYGATSQDETRMGSAASGGNMLAGQSDAQSGGPRP